MCSTIILLYALGDRLVFGGGLLLLLKPVYYMVHGPWPGYRMVIGRRRRVYRTYSADTILIIFVDNNELWL